MADNELRRTGRSFGDGFAFGFGFFFAAVIIGFGVLVLVGLLRPDILGSAKHKPSDSYPAVAPK